MPRIATADSEEAIALARILFREYAAALGVGVCLGDFDGEVASLPGRDSPPAGRLLLAFQDKKQSAEEAAGCVALRALDARTCEMKRLYVRANARGHGAGRGLVQALITEARTIGYQSMVLDTLPSMQAAQELYRSMKFLEIPSYQKNPIPGALFFRFRL
jgi:ribosomal protein S18 acetylase RimI-like enzyme